MHDFGRVRVYTPRAPHRPRGGELDVAAAVVAVVTSGGFTTPRRARYGCRRIVRGETRREFDGGRRGLAGWFYESF